MKHYIYSLLFVLVSASILSSCKSSIEEFYADIEQDRDDDLITGDDYEYQIPLIFHVFYQDSQNKEQYVDYNRLKELVAHVNELYQGDIYTYRDYENSVNVHIKFVLAEKNEQNQALAQPGVEYIKWTNSYPIDCNKFMGDKTRRYTRYVWDPNEYINVMVYPFAKNKDDQSITLGISVMPFTAAGYPQLEGLNNTNRTKLSKSNLKYAHCLCINSSYIYYESSRYKGQTSETEKTPDFIYDANNTLAHELGHYLGLHHVFAEKDGKPLESCSDTDYCTDTKSYNRPAYDTWLTEYIKSKNQESQATGQNAVLLLNDMIARHNDTGDTWSSINIMDYSMSLSYQLTEQQRHRIRQVLYYSPLMPGPKKDRPATRSVEAGSDEPLDLPVIIVK